MVIYRIRNLVNGKFYIGSAKRMKTRKAIHLYTLRRSQHHSPYLQAVYRKYGEAALKFEVLRDGIEDNHELLVWEQRYIDQLNPEYNMKRSADNSYGRPMTTAHREVLRNSRLGIPPVNKGIPMTSEQRALTAKKLICQETNTMYSSAWDASLAMNLTKINIRKACRSGSTAGGFHFNYIK